MTKLWAVVADHVIYHLDGPGAVRHLPHLLELDGVDCIRWVQGAGPPPPSERTGLLRRIQDAGKSVQVLCTPHHGADADLGGELRILRKSRDPNRLFFGAIVDSVAKADELVEPGHRASTSTRPASPPMVRSATPAPFLEGGALDHGSCPRVPARHGRLGATGLFAAGTCGEGLLHADRQRGERVGAVQTRAGGRLRSGEPHETP